MCDGRWAPRFFSPNIPVREIALPLLRWDYGSHIFLGSGARKSWRADEFHQARQSYQEITSRGTSREREGH